MFHKFTKILHQAAEALAPALPAQQEFNYHWKAITSYFLDNKDHDKVAIEQTNIQSHLDQMLSIMVSEEENMESGSTGPCMEYMLQHKLLETMYTLGRSDTPPGMKQAVLNFFTKLLSRIKQPLLPHVNVHKAVHRLIRVCGEVQAAPTETEEIQFLCTVCAKLKDDPYLVNFFIEFAKSKQSSEEQNASDKGSSSPAKSHQIKNPDFGLVKSLLCLSKSEDGRVCVKACEGLLLCCSLPEDFAASCIVSHTNFCDIITAQLCSLYEKMPKTIDPGDIEFTEAKWGLDRVSEHDDVVSFPGKRQLLSFLSWLDYCDQLINVAHPAIAEALAGSVRKNFLEKVLQPAILQTSEPGAITATAHLNRCLRLVTSKPLVKEFIYFVIGEDRQPEKAEESNPVLRKKLIERCNHLSEELSLISLKVFDTLLQKPNEHIFHNLVLRNLLGRDYLDESQLEEESVESRQVANGLFENNSIENEPVENEPAENEPLQNGPVENGSISDDLDEGKDEHRDEIVMNGPAELKDGDNEDFNAETDSQPSSVQSSPSRRHRKPDVHKVVNSFLCLVPEDAKSSYQMSDSGYDTYLRDAHGQFCDVQSICESWSWPLSPSSDPDYHQNTFFEGSFLKMLFGKIAGILNQNYDINLQVTSIMSKLALLPHANLHEYLMYPHLPLKEGTKSLYRVFQKLASDVEVRAKGTADFNKKLIAVRKQLVGVLAEERRKIFRHFCIEDSSMLQGVIVLEEFCKELAAIAFVKHHDIM